MATKQNTNASSTHAVHGNPHPSSSRQPSRPIGCPPDSYPWYDDRVTELRGGGSDPFSHGRAHHPDDDPTLQYDTPKTIYSYLNGLVWKQEDAKKAASVIMYHCLRGIKSNTLFIGPTGCGKTHIWRCLRQIFPNRIEIVDGSDITQEGWKGEKKWKDLLQFPAALSGGHAILVIDEADKMLAPKYANHENVSRSIQSEALTMLEGACVTVKSGSIVHEVDTSNISFVLCGAFSQKALDTASQSSRHIGFGPGQGGAVQPYEKPLSEQDLIDFGVMPEFLGRIQRIVSLQPMTADDYYRMTDNSFVMLQRIRQQYGVDIRLTPEKRRELAEAACAAGLGVRGMENKIRQFMDNAIFEDCGRLYYEF